MKQTMTKYVTVVVFVLAFAAVSAAQVAITPYTNIDFGSLGAFLADGEQIMGTTYTALSVGADVQATPALSLYGEASYGFGGELEIGGLTGTVEKNTRLAFSAGARYALLSTNGLSVGPVVDYTQSTWHTEDSADGIIMRANGFGAGLFANYDLDALAISASYIHRLSSTMTVKDIGAAVEESDTGGGNVLSISGAYALTDQVTLTGGYVINNEYITTKEGPTKGNKFASKGFSVGMRFSF